MSNDGRAFLGIGNVTRDIAAGDGSAGLTDLFIATGMIWINVSIQDIADRFRRRWRRS